MSSFYDLLPIQIFHFEPKEREKFEYVCIPPLATRPVIHTAYITKECHPGRSSLSTLSVAIVTRTLAI